MADRRDVLSGLAVTAGFADGVGAGLTGSPVAIAAIGAFVLALAFCIAKMTGAFGEWQYAKGALDAVNDLRHKVYRTTEGTR